MADVQKKILLQLEINVDEILRNIRTATLSLVDLKKQQQDTKASMAELEAQNRTAGATYLNLAAQSDKLRLAIVEQQKEVKKNEQVLILQAQASKAAQGSYEQLLRQFQLASIELKNQEGLIKKNEDGTFELSDAYKAAADKVENMKSVIIEFDQGIKDGRTNVGNYKAAIDAAFQSFEDSKDKVADLKFQIEQLNERIKAGGGDEKQFNQELQTLTSQLKIQTEETKNLGDKLDQLKHITSDSSEQFKSLRQRLREATNAATEAQDKFSAGLIDENQLLQAQQRVSSLRKEVEVFNLRVAALTPGEGFKAIGQVATSAAGGLEAAASAMGLFGANTDDAAKAILKFQQLRGLTQGLKEFKDIGNAVQNLGIVLGITTIKQQAQTIAQEETTVATEAGTVATTAMAESEVGAATATTGLSFAMKALTGTIGLVLIGITAAAAAFKTFENDDNKRSIEHTTKELQIQADAYKAATDAIHATTDASAQQLESELSLAQARGESANSIAEIEKKLLDVKLEGLQKERDENAGHLKTLKKQLDDSIEQRGKAKNQEQSDDAQRNADAAYREIKNAISKDGELETERKRLNAQFAVIDQQAEQQAKEEINRLSELRISVIKNDHERELEQQKLSTKEALDAILEGDENAAEKKALIAEEGAQKIAEIERQFALKTLQEKNQLAISLTREGTEQRIAAEIAGERSEAQELLKNEKLTQIERQNIVQDSENKILGFTEQRIKLLEQRANQEIDLERRKQVALQAIRSDSVSTPEGAFDADKKNIEENFKFQLDALNKANEDKFNSISDEANAELALNERNATEAQRQTQEFKDKQLKIIDDANKKILENDETTDALRKKLLIDTGNDLVAATQKRFDAEGRIKVLSLQRIQSELETELAGAEKGSEAELELKRKIEAIKNEITKAGIDTRLNFLKEELEVGKGLNEEEFAEYQLLLQNKAKADSEYQEKKRQEEKQTLDFIRQSSLDLFDKLLQFANSNAHAQTDVRLNQIQTTLNAQLEALNIAQQKEEGTFVQKTAIQQKYDREREAAQNKAAEQERDIKKRQFKADKDAAAVQAAIQGAVAAVKALPNYILVATVVATTAAEIALIESQPVPEFSEGGFTGEGNPKGESQRLGRKPYIYHLKEYVVPHQVLEDARAKPHVFMLEQLRLGSTIVDARASLPRVTMPMSYESGGFAEVQTSTFPIQQTIDLSALSEMIVSSTREAIKSLQVITDVKDVIRETGIITKVENGANI